MLDAKLQLKPGTTVAVVDPPAGPLDVAARRVPLAEADAVLVFVHTRTELREALPVLTGAADRLLWVAYPKAGQLGTDLNRDLLRTAVAEHGLDTVRQIAIDAVWSALRLRRAAAPAG